MKIGFIGQINESGHSYVTKNFADALKDDHDVFILASNSVKDGRIDTEGIWSDYEVTGLNCNYNDIGQRFMDVKGWVSENELDVVFFNEMYDWGLVNKVSSLGVKTVGYIDWFSKDWVPMFEKFYDATIICAEHTYDIFHEHENSHFVPWGVDLNLFNPANTFSDWFCPDHESREDCGITCGKATLGPGDKSLFFHSAGWGGINFRKCTPEQIKAFHKLWSESHDASFYLHTQTPNFDGATKDRIQRMRGDGLKVHLGSVSHPGLYNKGKVYSGVTKMEGLGLYIPEAMACGLPVITTDAYPMAQFVKNRETGWLIEPNGEHQRKDGYFFPEFDIDPEDIYEKYREVFEMSDSEIEKMGEKARKFMEENHSFEDHFKPEVLKVINSL